MCEVRGQDTGLQWEQSLGYALTPYLHTAKGCLMISEALSVLLRQLGMGVGGHGSKQPEEVNTKPSAITQLR